MSDQLYILQQTAQFQLFESHGYLKVEALISDEEILWYRQCFDQFISGEIATGSQRSDLSGIGANEELITQIMRPSLLYSELATSALYKRVLALARMLMGGDMEIDFDMLINKAPHTQQATPWHQDAAYWIDMPDKRALSCWIALDDATIDNGCMWYVPGSHLKPLRQHQQIVQGGPLICECSESEGLAVPLKAGEGTFHHGRTLHYSRGNVTSGQRRAIIINCRPEAMIAYERERGFDHLGERDIRSQEEE